MKNVIISFLLVVPTISLADVQAYQAAPCSYWMPATNGFGYVCQNIPLRFLVPEARSTANELKIISDRVTKLETQLLELSKSCKN